MSYVPRLKQRYLDKVIPALKEKFKYKNNMQVPKIEKIVLNMGMGKSVQDSKVLEEAVEELTVIAGQKPIVTQAKLSVSNFKLREGMKIGTKVTLRSGRMYEFLDKLINVTLPRVRDFRGILKRSFDGKGNYNLGIKDFTIFPEINSDRVKVIKGMDISFVTTSKTDEEAYELLNGLGMPYRKN